MPFYIKNRITLVWLLLVGATLFSWGLGHGVALPDPRQAGVVILIVAFVKVWFVFFEFMEVRHAPSSLRNVVRAWIGIVCTTVIVIYWLGSAQGSAAHWPHIPGL